MYVFLLFPSKFVSFLLDYLYLFFQLNVSTLLAVSYGNSGTLIVGFSILLMDMVIFGTTVLVVYYNVIGNCFMIFHKSDVCFCFPKSNSLYSSLIIGAF